MKFLKKMLFVAAAVLMISACNKETASEKIEGSYACYSSASCAYFQDMIGEGDTVTIVAQEENADITVKSTTWGTASFSGLTVTEEGDNAILSGNGTIAMPGMDGTVSNYDATVKGTVALDKSTMELTATLPSVMGGMTIVFKNGTAPASK